MVELEQIETTKIEINSPKVYPLVEEMTFRAIIRSEDEGYQLLRAIQILINELGTDMILSVMDTIEKKPILMQKAKSYLPYLKML